MRILPKSLFGRLVLLLLTGLVLAQTLSAFILLRDRGQVLYESIRENMIVRTAGIVRLLDSLPIADRQKMISLLSGPDLQIALSKRVALVPQADQDSIHASEWVQQRLRKRLPQHKNILVTVEGSVMEPQTPSIHRRHMMMSGPMSGPWAYMHGVHAMARFFHIQIALEDGTWVNFQHGVPKESFDWPGRLIIVLTVLLASVISLSLVGVRLLIHPLHALRQAAEGLGKDIRQSPLEEAGPIEVRATAKAFNTMQARLKSYIEDRSGILTAVSHDLKTPLTRIRLRSELMEDEELKTKIGKDLDDMEKMVGATLDFMRGTEIREPTQPLDLVALLESIQEDALEAGKSIKLGELSIAPYQGKPLALKRCIVNLVDNAVRYGQEAMIATEDSGTAVIVKIFDKGPGIPEEAMKKVFDPFFRLESSRTQQTGGSGLGLGIARNIARAHGGDLILSNLNNGGLCATLTLPR